MVPNRAEQDAIVANISRREAELRQAQFLVERAISCLGEYRSALITNAVTGKIDVRGEVAKEAAA